MINSIMGFLWRHLHIHKTVDIEGEVLKMGIFWFLSYTRYRVYSICIYCGKEFVDTKIHIERS